MMRERRLICVVSLLLLLTACSQTALPTPQATFVRLPPINTQVPGVTVTAIAEKPSATPEEATAIIPTVPSSEPAATTEPTAESFALAAAPMLPEQLVLSLAPGSADAQVAIVPNPNDTSQIQGPSSFRIGSDATIRVLDRGNKRVLFFSPEGQPGRVQPITEANDPIDYIVNNNGEVFVLDNGVYNQDNGFHEQKQILLYKPDGALNTRYPIADAVQANGIMLNTQQDLFVVSGSFYENATTISVLAAGQAVNVAHQFLTRHRGLPTPRSPMMFLTRVHTSDDIGAGMDVLLGQVAAEPRLIMDNLALPATAQFLNVDRAMNLYFMNFVPDANIIQLWRVAPDTTIVGGGAIDLTGCQAFDWRSIYAAQDGEIWRMCNMADRTIISRYNLIGMDGQPLAKVEKIDEAAAKNVPWAPGGNFSAA